MIWDKAGKERWMLTAATDVGNYREVNQDNFYLMEELLSCKELERFVTKKERKGTLLCAVCDGMGGGAKGEEAAMLALQLLQKTEVEVWVQYGTEKLLQEMNAYIQEISDIIYGQFRKEKIFTGCTMTILYADKKRSLVGNIGDSPCILLNKDGYKVISVSDNRANQLYQLGRITEKERWTHKTKNQLTQYLGMNPAEVRLSPHFFVGNPVKKDEVYILATDGLLDNMELEEILTIVRAKKSGNTAENLVDAALRKGSRDNVTAVLIKRRRRI